MIVIIYLRPRLACFGVCTGLRSTTVRGLCSTVTAISAVIGVTAVTAVVGIAIVGIAIVGVTVVGVAIIGVTVVGVSVISVTVVGVAVFLFMIMVMITVYVIPLEIAVVNDFILRSVDFFTFLTTSRHGEYHHENHK